VFAALTAGFSSVAAWPGCIEWPIWWVKHIALDGKTLRGSAGRSLEPLHLVSAWATQPR